MKLYHGSEKIIPHPVYGYGKIYNDYGKAFYCTESVDMAKEWSVSREHGGYANCYELDADDLQILDLNDESFCLLHWLTILLRYRTFDLNSPLSAEANKYLLKYFYIDCEVPDLIIGYRADDSYFSFAQDFISGRISYRQLSDAMHLGKLGLQIAVKSKQAFSRLSFLGYETASQQEWLEKKERRDRMARKAYFDLDRNRWQKGDLYMVQILEEEMKADDPRLR